MGYSRITMPDPISTTVAPPAPKFGSVDNQRVRQTIEFRFNPVRYATPDRLSSELDGLIGGRLGIARFWECMQARDPFIGTADKKRRDAVERMQFQVVICSDVVDAATQKLAEEQKQVLGKFYGHLTVTDVLRQDQRGGIGLLARQMLDARAKGWAVHEWIWKPRTIDGQWTTAEFRHCPLYWFENTTGRLRFLPSDFALYGTDMNEREWLVTVADDYMQCLTANWLYSLNLVRAWVRFCERFGFPLPHGKTPAAKDSPEWDALVEALAAINEDWALVTNVEADVLLVEAKNTGTSVPFQSLLERFDRITPTVILGGDLSTISAGSGAGQGASLQGKEDARREQADASLLSETLNQRVDRHVLEYVFGIGCPILAKAAFVPPKQVDVAAELQVQTFAAQNGIEVAVDDFRETFGLKQPDEDDEVIRPLNVPAPGTMPPNAADTAPGAQLANAATAEQYRQQLIDIATREAAAARAEDLQSIARELDIIMGITNPGDMEAALKRWLLGHQDRARRLIASPSRLAPAIEHLLTAAVMNGMEATPTSPADTTATA